MKTYDIFLFDADNTLFDFDLAERYALQATFEFFGLIYTDAIRIIYREINTQVWSHFEKGQITKPELQKQRFSLLFERIGISLDAMAFNNHYLQEIGKCTFLMDGALEICRHIVASQKKIYIVTNGILVTQTSRMEHSVLKDYISDCFVSEYVGYQKPHPSYFEYVFAHIPKLQKDKTIIIGDSLTADIAGGLVAGIDSCWLNTSAQKNTTDIVPTYEIHNLKELYPFI